MEHIYDLPAFRSGKNNSIIIQLENTVSAFSGITEIPVSFFSAAGKYLWSTMPEKRICSANRDFGSDSFDCTRNLLSSMNISLSLPDVYIFMCNSDFINFCHPIIFEKKVYGFLMAGPVAMGNSIEKITDSFSNKIAGLNLDTGRLVQLLREIKVFSPKEINHLMTIFSACINSVLGSSSSEDIRYQQYTEQSELNNKLVIMKKAHLTVDYPYESENNLIEIVSSGNTELCRKKFGKYVEDILVFEQGNMSITRLRLVAFFTQMLKQNESWQKDYNNLFLIEKINDAQTIKEIMQAGYTLIYNLAEYVSKTNYSGKSDVVKKAITYISSHYRDSITLRAAASEIHVNETYLSTLFKKETGKTFISYLNDIRLAHSKKLLSDTSMSVTDICLNTGFSSPSYFSKLFRQKYGLTPNEFRRSSP